MTDIPESLEFDPRAPIDTSTLEIGFQDETTQAQKKKVQDVQKEQEIPATKSVLKPKKHINSVSLNGERIRIHKWRGSDKKKFLNALLQAGNTEEEEELSVAKTMDILVHNALETHKDKKFSHEEYKFLLSRIRAFSLGDDMSVALDCNECGTEFDYDYKITDVLKAKDESLTDFSTQDLNITFGPIKNKDDYLTTVEKNPELEIIFRISSINGIPVSQGDAALFLDELDLETLDELDEHFNNGKFRVQDTQEVQCPNCDEITLFRFDEIPGFFPDSWFTELYQNALKNFGE